MRSGENDSRVATVSNFALADLGGTGPPYSGEGTVGSCGACFRTTMSSARQAERGDGDGGGDSGRTLIAVGLGIAAAAFAGRHAFRFWKPVQQIIVEMARTIPSPGFPTYYKGGFEAKMNKREANLILGISSSANRTKIGEAHKRIMLLNHPDRGKWNLYTDRLVQGGSPYLAAKINEAKDLLDSSIKK
ncbi:dnaJ homolog subfamily C member 15-like isoform X2 [Stegostoma tigrinum]|uniref:dnaJ homolog subfamily C member 15-like isoform X2 n=1 Tax=Stegostoma tigrinum TaxID=3053191 RepID=UPI00202B37F0|nr:dnaJ homolog subfamily C member 15-like isoform X2 [Stegostoma tigrinum]